MPSINRSILLIPVLLLSSKASIIHVPSDQNIIQDAIDAASDGDTIMVQDGNYFEILTINKSINLISADKKATKIYGSNVKSSQMNIIKVNADSCNIQGFTLTKNGVTHDVVPHFMERFGEAYLAQIQDFTNNVLKDKEPTITAKDDVAALKVCLAATKSLHENYPIKLTY